MEKYNIFQKLIVWIIDCWRLVMDNRYNPLRYIADPSIQAYFTLVLFIMWSAYFGIVATVYMGFNYDIVTSIIIHMAFVVPLMFTNLVFKQAEKNGRNWISQYRTDQEKKKCMDVLNFYKEELFKFEN